ncbi:MAG: hypothetical protein H7177_11990 [Rhizobacter sp.]|nr:hypothetical protein [Bacteriovorax sp.]
MKITTLFLLLYPFISQIHAQEVEPVKLKKEIILCSSDDKSEWEAKGFASVIDFLGDATDQCVKIAPTARGDTYKVFTGPAADKVTTERADIFLHSRRTSVNKIASSDLATLTPTSKAKNHPSDLFVDISPTGMKILKLFVTYKKQQIIRADMDVIFWAPKIETTGTM